MDIGTDSEFHDSAGCVRGSEADIGGCRQVGGPQTAHRENLRAGRGGVPEFPDVRVFRSLTETLCANRQGRAGSGSAESGGSPVNPAPVNRGSGKNFAN